MKTIKLLRTSIFLFVLTTVFFSCSKSDDDPSQNSMDIISMDPDSPASLNFNDFVVITFYYNIVAKDGARMWIIPYTNGDKSPGYLYSSSSVYTGTGTKQVGISIEDGDGPVVVDQIKITMTDPDQEETFIERFQNVDFTFGE